jgi:tight adherence protein C
MTMNFAIPALIFGSVVMLALALRSLLAPRVVGRRLAGLGNSAQPVAIEGESLVHGKDKGLSGIFSRIGRGREGADLSRLRSRLLHAGYRKPSAPKIYYGVRISFALGAPALAALLPQVWALPSYMQIGVLILLSALFYVLPSIVLDNRIKARQHAIALALPDALDLMVVCVEAGFGINQSLAQVADEFESKCPIVAAEFSLVVLETRAGKSTTEALRTLADRTGVSDISSLVALLVQTERFGTSLSNALRVHADAMRIIRMQRAEERAQKATLKLILPSTMIFAALLLIFLAPGAYMMMSAFESL